MTTPDSDWKKSQDHEKVVYSERETIPSTEKAREAFRSFGKDISEVKESRILSIGAGMGIIHSIDFDCENIAVDPLTHHNQNKLKDSSAILITGVGENLPLKNNSVDIVHSYNALDHCIRPKKVLKEAHRVTKNNGELLLEVNTYEVPEFIRSSLIGFLDSEHPHHFSSDEIQETVNEIGYEVLEDNCISRLELLKNPNIRRIGGILFRMRRYFIFARK